MNRGYRPPCPECRYTTVMLNDFDGTWSGDAVEGEARDPLSYFRWGMWLVLWDLLCAGFKMSGRENRKTKVERLRKEVLPDFPDSLICPSCLHVIYKRD